MAKREIHSLDLAICKVMSLLDVLFSGLDDENKGWESASARGIDIICVEPYENRRDEVLVLFRPACWPDSSTICCRFNAMSNGEWIPYKGQVNAPHVPFYLSFKCDGGLPLHIEPRESGTPAARLCEEKMRGLYPWAYQEGATG